MKKITNLTILLAIIMIPQVVSAAVPVIGSKAVVTKTKIIKKTKAKKAIVVAPKNKIVVPVVSTIIADKEMGADQYEAEIRARISKMFDLIDKVKDIETTSYADAARKKDLARIRLNLNDIISDANIEKSFALKVSTNTEKLNSLKKILVNLDSKLSLYGNEVAVLKSSIPNINAGKENDDVANKESVRLSKISSIKQEILELNAKEAQELLDLETKYEKSPQIVILESFTIRQLYQAKTNGLRNEIAKLNSN